MTSSTRIRFGALTAAAAVVAGGFFAAVPANAATTTLTAANTTFTVGDWGTGLDLTGTGFTADGGVTITLDSSAAGQLDTTTATADSTGAFALAAWIPGVPLAALAAGETLSVTATDDTDTTLTASVKLTVNPAAVVEVPVLEPKGISTSVTTITTADLSDSTKGFDVHASGYTPDENVKVTVNYNGSIQTLGTGIADETGAIDVLNIHVAIGLAGAGTLTVTATGETSGVTNSATVTVIGEDVVVGDPDVPADFGGTTTADDSTAPVVNLPVVAG